MGALWYHSYMPDDTINRSIPLSLASDAELAQELVQRSVVSSLHGMIFITARPQEGAPTQLTCEVDVLGGSVHAIDSMVQALNRALSRYEKMERAVVLPDITPIASKPLAQSRLRL